MEAIQSLRSLTYDEYEKLEQESEIRYEFEAGQVTAMAGGTLNHNELIGNIYSGLKSQVRRKTCKTYFSDVKVEVLKDTSYRYPDVVVACHPFDLRGQGQMIRQPRLIVEVLSNSTEHVDRGVKWQRYRKIPSLIYYLLIDQYKVTVELYSRVEQTEEWLLTTYESLDDVLVLPRLNAELSLAAIYEDIEFGGEEEEGEGL